MSKFNDDFDYDGPEDEDKEPYYPEVYYMGDSVTTDPGVYYEWYNSEGKYEDPDYWITHDE